MNFRTQKCQLVQQEEVARGELHYYQRLAMESRGKTVSTDSSIQYLCKLLARNAQRYSEVDDPRHSIKVSVWYSLSVVFLNTFLLLHPPESSCGKEIPGAIFPEKKNSLEHAR